jgi:hypothetical protein
MFPLVFSLSLAQSGSLGDLVVAELTAEVLRKWLATMAAAPAQSCSFRQPPRLRRFHRVLPQCSDSVAMGAIADTADAHSKRRF